MLSISERDVGVNEKPKATENEHGAEGYEEQRPPSGLNEGVYLRISHPRGPVTDQLARVSIDPGHHLEQLCAVGCILGREPQAVR